MFARDCFLCKPYLIAMFELPSVPTSAPLNVSVDDVNDSSLTIKWKTPETIGDSGLDGYTIEYCKDGSKSLECVCVCGCTCPHSGVRGQIQSSLVSGRIRQTACQWLSPYLLRPLLALPICLDDSTPSEISQWQPSSAPWEWVVNLCQWAINHLTRDVFMKTVAYLKICVAALLSYGDLS